MNTKIQAFSIQKTVQGIVLFLLFCLPATAIAKPYYQGNRYYYNILSTKSYAAESQALYNALVVKADELHQDFTTTFPDDVWCVVNPLDFGFRKTENNGQNYTLETLSAIELAFVAFFQDNVQYFMFTHNLGWDSNFNHLVYFDKPDPKHTPTEQLYDYRLPADRKAHMDLVDSMFAKYRKLTKDATSKYEIARYIHDQIVSDWDYAEQTLAAGAHDLIGPMGYAQNGIVCEAYAKMFAFMANNLGVPASFIPGDMTATNGFPKGAHAWNMALMDDGNYYFLDATWADNQRTNSDIGNYRNPISYSWFLLGHDNGNFEARHFAGVGSMLTVYERPANIGGPDYDYKNLYSYKFLGDIPADRSGEFDLGTYYMPANGALDIQPKYYDQSLVCGVDYEMEFEQPLQLGKNRVWFHGKGNYRGVDFGVVNLVAASSSLNIKVTLSAEMYEYTGQPVEPAPTVKNGSVTLIEGLDYLVSYQNNINRGTAKLIVTGLGTYAGYRHEKEFQIIVKSNGTNISAADFDALWSNIENCLVVIKKSGTPPKMEKNVLERIQNAADFYGITIYYIDWEANITNYHFYNLMMNKLTNAGYDRVENFPLLAVVGSVSNFGVDAAEKHSSGGYEYGLMSEEDIRAMIRKYINIITTPPTGTPTTGQPQSLQAYTSNGKLHLVGLTTGMPLVVYSMTGLVHQATATGDQMEISLPNHGVYVVKSGKNSIILCW